MIRARALTLTLAAFLATPLLAEAQSGLSDFLVTGGLAWESYNGNFSVVTVPTVDSTRHATAAIGEFGARVEFNVLRRERESLVMGVDGGLRQFVAAGFQLRDYAPREYVSGVSARYDRTFGGVGRLVLAGDYRGRSVVDRPPMPLFLGPGFKSFRGSGGFQLEPIQNVSLDARADIEQANYDAPRLLPHLDLLDRESQGVEVGATATGGGDWQLRFYSGFRWSHYGHQSTQAPDDPFRRDRTVSIGALWSLDRFDSEGPVRQAHLGVEGTINRSNSRRPQYDALSVTGDVFSELPWWQLEAKMVSLLTWKTYVHETQFARLVPGEEADNASVVHLDLIRPVASNLTTTLRLGWTRAETDIGNSYYSRYGLNLLFNFRPAIF